jgi:hypothetical protein
MANNEFYPKTKEGKSIFSSMTIIGLSISMMSRFFEIGLNSDDVISTYSLIIKDWPLISGIVIDIWGKISRYNKSQFNYHFIEDKTFWLTLFALVASIIGIEQQDQEEIVNHLNILIPKITMICGGVLAIIGSIRASKEIKKQ